MFGEYPGSIPSTENRLSNARNGQASLRIHLDSLNEALDTLIEAKKDMENAEADLKQAMTGDYTTLEIVNSEYQGKSAQSQKEDWEEIQTMTNNLKIKVGDTVEDLDDEIRKKRNDIADTKKTIDDLSKLISDLQSEANKEK